MNSINYQIEENKVVLYIDGIEAGHIEVAKEVSDSYKVENVKVEEQYRGQGFYKGLILAAFQLFNMETLRSYNRNDKSNGIYENWTGEDLNKKTSVFIQVISEQMYFTVDSE